MSFSSWPAIENGVYLCAHRVEDAEEEGWNKLMKQVVFLLVLKSMMDNDGRWKMSKWMELAVGQVEDRDAQSKFNKSKILKKFSKLGTFFII